MSNIPSNPTPFHPTPEHAPAKTDLSAVQQWANDNNVLAEQGAYRRKHLCQCGEDCNVFQVRKAGPNHGRLFVSCKNCQRFQWLDLPLCHRCGERKYQAQSKSGNPKNYGRWFLNCPNRCARSFKWLDRRIGGGGWEIV